MIMVCPNELILPHLQDVRETLYMYSINLSLSLPRTRYTVVLGRYDTICVRAHYEKSIVGMLSVLRRFRPRRSYIHIICTYQPTYNRTSPHSRRLRVSYHMILRFIQYSVRTSDEVSGMIRVFVALALAIGSLVQVCTTRHAETSFYHIIQVQHQSTPSISYFHHTASGQDIE